MNHTCFQESSPNKEALHPFHRRSSPSSESPLKGHGHHAGRYASLSSEPRRSRQSGSETENNDEYSGLRRSSDHPLTSGTAPPQLQRRAVVKKVVIDVQFVSIEF